MNRTCDLRFRKPNNCVHTDLTSSEKPYFVRSFDQLMATSPGTYLSVCATSVQQSFSRGLPAATKLLCGNAAEFGFCWEIDSKPWQLVFFASDSPQWSIVKNNEKITRCKTISRYCSRDLSNSGASSCSISRAWPQVTPVWNIQGKQRSNHCWTEIS